MLKSLLLLLLLFVLVRMLFLLLFVLVIMLFLLGSAVMHSLGLAY